MGPHGCLQPSATENTIILMSDYILQDRMAMRAPRRPAVSDADFRSALSGLASGVHVVTAADGVERVGRTVTSVLSLSDKPPSVLVSIDNTSRLSEIIARKGSFSMAMLAADQSEVGDAFAGRLGLDDRFVIGNWGTWASGQPKLGSAVSVIDCEVIGSMETPTHLLFAGAIVEAETDTSLMPLIWNRHGYHGLGGLD